MTLDCQGYGTPAMRGIPLTSRYATVSHFSGKLGISGMSKRLVNLTINRPLNILYDWSRVSMRGWEGVF
jgi:hypothetical protein